LTGQRKVHITNKLKTDNNFAADSLTYITYLMLTYDIPIYCFSR
jgi:hypothetical protein